MGVVQFDETEPMPVIALASSQARVLAFVAEHVRARGRGARSREIAAACGISVSTAANALVDLKRLGYIDYPTGKPRLVKVLASSQERW